MILIKNKNNTEEMFIERTVELVPARPDLCQAH